MTYDVYAVGNALVDIQTRVDDATLTRTGYEKGVMTLVDEDTQRRVLDAIAGCSVSQCAGGSAANTVAGIAGFGGKAAFTGKVRDDSIGESFLRDLTRMGIAFKTLPSREGVTGTCVVLITQDAQRTMLTHLGVSSDIGPDDVNEDDVRHSQYVYVEGYLFTGEKTRAAALHAIELAKRNDVKVALTVSDPALVEAFRDDFLPVIRESVDLLFCNLDEARRLSGHEDPVNCIHTIHEYTQDVALTMGADGSLIIHSGQLIPIEGVDVDAVDTTGAGDMYAAGILYGITNGLTWRQAGRLASHAAGRVVADMGARLRTPFTQDEIDRICGKGMKENRIGRLFYE